MKVYAIRITKWTQFIQNVCITPNAASCWDDIHFYMSNIEMSEGSSTSELISWWDLLEQAAKAHYGNSIKLIKTTWTLNKLGNMERDFEISFVSSDEEPKETRRTILDINMKEYTNNSKEVDQTVVKVVKTLSKSSGSRYQYAATKGVDWGISSNIGGKVMILAMAGGSTSFGGNYGRQKHSSSEEEMSQIKMLQFSYEQEERISVPPMTRVKAKITTYSMKYEQGFALKFSIPASYRIPVTYKTRCQQTFCGVTIRYLSVTDLLQTLPGYCVEKDTASFIEPGNLSWVGEGSSIDKVIEPLGE